MTKYKKLTRSSFVIVALCLALVGILAFGGTYAYFSASDTATGTATIGTLQVSLKDNTTDMDNVTFATAVVQPNQEILNKEVTIAKGDTNIAFYARIKFEATVAAKAGVSHKEGCGDSTLTADTVLTPELTGWIKLGDGYYYQAASKDAKATVNTDDVKFTPVVTLNSIIGKGGCTYYMGGTVTVTITVEVLQADYLKDSTTTGAASSYTAAQVSEAWANA